MTNNIVSIVGDSVERRQLEMWVLSNYINQSQPVLPLHAHRHQYIDQHHNHDDHHHHDDQATTTSLYCHYHNNLIDVMDVDAAAMVCDWLRRLRR